jgi:hypothetical protein
VLAIEMGRPRPERSSERRWRGGQAAPQAEEGCGLLALGVAGWRSTYQLEEDGEGGR